MDISTVNTLKQKFTDTQTYCHKHFAKQGSFALYYSKEMDFFVKESYELVLKDFFEDFLPSSVPICIFATKLYASNKLTVHQGLDLLFVYKDLKAYNLRQIIKASIRLLEDIGCKVFYDIYELSAIQNKTLNIINTRFLCGSKQLFKSVKDEFRLSFLEKKSAFLDEIRKNTDCKLSFLKQEFNIKKDFGGLNDIKKLDELFMLFKDELKAMFSEDELSKIRLSSDFLLSLQAAMNLNLSKDTDMFLLNDTQNIAKLMFIKDKKNLHSYEILLSKSLACRHFIGLCLLNILKDKDELLLKDTNCNSFLQKCLNLDDCFKPEFVLHLSRLDFANFDLDIFKQILCKEHSFHLLRLLLDSKQMKHCLKPFFALRFVMDYEHEYSTCDNALLCVKEVEENYKDFNEFNLSQDEFALLKLSILLAFLKEDNELSLANIYRAYASKLNFKPSHIDKALLFCKNFHLMKDIVFKEDIDNETVIFSLISRFKKQEDLRLLYLLTKLSAKALNYADSFFLNSLNKLLENSLNAFLDESFLDESTRRLKKEQILKRNKDFLALSSSMQNKICHIKSNLFFIKNSFEKIIFVSVMADENSYKIILNNEKNLVVELFAKSDFRVENILFLLANLNLLSMNFYELFDDKIYLRFEYSDVLSDEDIQKLYKILEKRALNIGKNEVKKPMIKKDELKFVPEYSKNYVKLSLNTKDSKGLMAFVMSVFAKFNLKLSAAKIQTVRQRTRNTFIFEKTDKLLDFKQELINSLTME